MDNTQINDGRMYLDKSVVGMQSIQNMQYVQIPYAQFADKAYAVRRMYAKRAFRPIQTEI